MTQDNRATSYPVFCVQRRLMLLMKKVFLLLDGGQYKLSSRIKGPNSFLRITETIMMKKLNFAFM